MRFGHRKHSRDGETHLRSVADPLVRFHGPREPEPQAAEQRGLCKVQLDKFSGCESVAGQ